MFECKHVCISRFEWTNEWKAVYSAYGLSRRKKSSHFWTAVEFALKLWNICINNIINFGWLISPHSSDSNFCSTLVIHTHPRATGWFSKSAMLCIYRERARFDVIFHCCFFSCPSLFLSHSLFDRCKLASSPSSSSPSPPPPSSAQCHCSACS